MPEVKRRRSETFESFLRRFNRRVMGSGKILEARKIQFYKPGQTKRARRLSALRREKMRSQYEYLQKTGRLPDEDTKKRPKHRRA